MGMLARLSDKEKNMIENYIDYYVGSVDCEVDHILRFWDQAKSQYLSKMFGEQLILSKRVEFHKGEDELDADMRNAITNNWGATEVEAHEFYKVLSCKVNEFYNYDKGYEFGEAFRLLDANVLCSWALAKNRVEEDFQIPTPDGKGMKIQKGQKVLKVIAKLADIFKIKGYEEFRLAHSRVHNQKKLTGTMNISIHPLDYMTMSDNNCGWSSCMSWAEDGCYKQGTVEMMNSCSVVVAYLASDTPMWMPGEEKWNSKKWRQLFIVTPEVIANVKAYPYRNDNLTLCVIDWLKELATTAGIGQYDEKNYKLKPGYSFDLPGTDRTMSIDFITDAMYNDFSSSRDDQYIAYGAALREVEGRYFEWCYSGQSECMRCGGTDGDWCDGNETSLCCENCDPHKYCDCCGERIYDGDEYWLDGCCYCEYCYDDHYARDYFTEDGHYDGNMRYIHICNEEANKTLSCIDIPVYYEDVDYAIRRLRKEYLVDGAKIYTYHRHQWGAEEYAIRICDFKQEMFIELINDDELSYCADCAEWSDIERLRNQYHWDEYGYDIPEKYKSVYGE